MLQLVVVALAAVSSALGAWTSTSFSPPSIPLAVKTPYLSAWLPQGSGRALNEDWAKFWTGSTLGWAGFARVDGTVYRTMGVPGNSATLATQTAMSFTSTSSKFTLTVGPVRLIYTFLSPVTPSDYLRQSIPFSYMSITAQSTDGASHSVQLYTDISAEWVTGDVTLQANWTTTQGSVFTHQVQLVSQTVFSEKSDHIQHGAAYYSTNNATGLTFQTGQDSTVRSNFISSGTLPNTQDTTFRAVNDRWPVFAYARDLGSVSSTASAPVVFAVGHIRDPGVQYITAGNVLQSRPLYFLSQLSTPAAVIKYFLDDFSNATSTAATFDAKVQSDAAKINTGYASLVALSIRQVFAAFELTVSKTSSGAFNATDLMVFQKEISSSGNMNTVDVIFPSWPSLLYTNPVLGKLMLEPLFQYQTTGCIVPNKWSIHDVGASYPKALGHNDGSDEAMPVEESGNMIIMSLSYALKTGDNSQMQRYFSLLDQWTQFLIEDSLIPAEQLSTDDFAGYHLANQTNLAIKGIIGIGAMGKIATILGDTAKGDNYTAIAKDYVTRWQTLAMASGGEHLTLSYNDNASWGQAYNLWADKLLKLNLFPQSVYDTQTAWYKTHRNAYGLPLDTRHTYAKTDWTIWTASIVSDTTLRDQLIGDIVKYASDGLNDQPLGDWYETTNGAANGFKARPVAGGHLALVSQLDQALASDADSLLLQLNL
ncbi:DUF1793-domain-containing protein [Auriculariales sp. MPI-PUGE-AT-0066]|nr:DUF1793-domain-containing protein [Auriculariales sp. MPI-PUGE-AT-0066]